MYKRQSYNSPNTPERVYSYNLKNKKKKFVKEQEIPSGHIRNNYIVERRECNSADGRKVPLTIIRHRNTKLNGSANILYTVMVHMAVQWELVSLQLG